MSIPGFLNTVNMCAIFAMVLYYIARVVFFKEEKSDGSAYLYIAVIASMLNIMRSINLSDAVFWYGANLESGVRGSVFIVVSSFVFFIFSKILGRKDNQGNVDTASQLKNVINGVDNLREKYLNLKSEIASASDVVVKIHSISEDVKKNELIIKEMAEDMQKISDSMATLAEEFLKMKNK